jgi:hypothetical protein
MIKRFRVNVDILERACSHNDVGLALQALQDLHNRTGWADRDSQGTILRHTLVGIFGPGELFEQTKRLIEDPEWCKATLARHVEAMRSYGLCLVDEDGNDIEYESPFDTNTWPGND